MPHWTRSPAARSSAALAALALAACAPSGPAPLGLEEKYTRWARYEAEPGATHFSALDQIDRSNVQRLEVAWTYANGATSFNPVIADSMMYVIGPLGSVVALHAGTGRELWSFASPAVGGGGFSSNRGLMYWESPDRSDRRVFIVRNNALIAIDARTGRRVASFGENGQVDAREGIARDRNSVSANLSSPGVFFEKLVILGSAPGEAYGSGPGDIRAFDAVTGKLAWVFHTIPHPGEPGYETWPADAYRTAGGVNAWGGMSVDEERGIVYVPLGSATYDFYGGDRPGDNLFANSLVALDARTGKRLWHYQTVHHDLWDYDLTATPTLLTVRHQGRMRDIVAQASKQGFLFVFDRVTGEPLWPIEERPVPRSEMPGETTSPTQPFPTWPRPFAVQSFTEADVNPYVEDAAERDSLRRVVRESLNLGLFTPPSTRPTMQMPGNAGGANWGTTGGDPRDGSFYVVTKNLPTVLKLEPILPGVFGTGTNPVDHGQALYQRNCQVCHQPGRQGQPPQIPSLIGITERLSQEQIRTIVHEGRGTMPAFRDFNGDDLYAISAYLTDPQMASPPPVVSAQAASEGAGPRRYQTGYGYFSASGGTWAIKPPWVTMTKYDLNTGEIRWQIPVGEVESLTARGITGTGASDLRGGPAITAGGLVFMMTRDKLRAYDSDTGRELWARQLPAAGDGIPAVYQYGGRQYVVVGIGAARAGSGGPTTPSYLAFALPASALGGR